MHWITRRGLPALALATVAPRAGHTQDFPTRPIRLVVGFAPGGGLDLTARPIANRMSQLLGQPVTVENRTGANGNLAGEFVARQPADGYTLLHANSGMLSIGPHLFRNLSFDYGRDFVAVCGVVFGPAHVMVSATLPVNSLAELIAYARANPGKLNFASGGVGTLAHLAFELLRRREGLDMTHVPYRGTGPAVVDMISGRMHVMIDGVNQVRGQVDAGQIRLLAVAGPERSVLTPAVPTTGELGFGWLQAIGWQAIMAPSATPAAIRARLETAVRTTLEDRVLTAHMESQGTLTRFIAPAEMRRIIADDFELWGGVIRDANVTVE